MTCLLVSLFISCDSGGGGSSLTEYDKEYVNIINSYWDGAVRYKGDEYSVSLNIPDDSRYIFYIGGYVDDRGTYERDYNTATLVSDYSKGIVIGKATITDPNTVYVSLNNNSGYPGAKGTVKRRKK